MGCCSGQLQLFDEKTGAPMVNPEDYWIEELLNTGGFGIVYRAVRKSDNQAFAMKFFGYTDNIPTEEEIDMEIELMASLNDLDGVLHLEGIFYDTKSGMMTNLGMPKTTPLPYKVIVMDLATGGDLFDRIKEKGRSITENYIATSFRTALTALREIHHARYLHRDLKVENLIAINKDDNSPIKLIDFGMMTRLPDGEEKLVDPQKPGTPSYIAPESFALGIYTCKSDVWQAGLCLYCTVCAEYAFDVLPLHRGMAQKWKFKQEKTFRLLSTSIQDLLSKMLHPVESERISLDDVLQHPWFHGEAPNVLLGERYEKRIQKLKLRADLKNFFMSNDIATDNAQRSAELKRNLKPAMTPRGISQFKGVPIESLNKLKEVIYQGLIEKVKRSGSFTDDGRLEEEDSSPPALERTYTDLVLDGWVDYEGFERLMISVDLQSMANRKIFKIFDVTGSGVIHLKQFLMAMVSFRRADDPFPDAARLFFDMFDIDGNGKISRTELHIVTECLLEDGMTESVAVLAKDIENLYETIHNKDEASIEFAEFKVFYEKIIRRSLSPHRADLPSPAPRVVAAKSYQDMETIVEGIDCSPASPPSPSKIKLPAGFNGNLSIEIT